MKSTKKQTPKQPTCESKPGPGGPHDCIEERDDGSKSPSSTDLHLAHISLNNGSRDQYPRHSEMEEVGVCAGRTGMESRERRHPIGDVEKSIWDVVGLRRHSLVSVVRPAATQDPFELVHGDGLGPYWDQRLLSDSVDEVCKGPIEGSCGKQGTRHTEEDVVSLQGDLMDAGDGEQEEEYVVGQLQAIFV